MTEEEARAELALMVAADTEPKLDAEQMESLVAVARRPDANGRVWPDEEWEPTWNLARAAVEGWLRKAGIAARKFDFAEDQQRFNRAQVFAHCQQQANIYRLKVRGSGKATGADCR